jgi:predicted DNA-binding protein
MFRTYQMSERITVRLTVELARWLDLLSERTGLSRSRIVRDILERGRSARRSNARPAWR